MKQFYITEDTRAAKLYVTFSHTLSNIIDTIGAYNQNKHDGIIQLANYLEGLKEYLSNPQIAFDYAHKYQHFRNGAIHLEELGYYLTEILYYILYQVFAFSYDYIKKQKGNNIIVIVCAVVHCLTTRIFRQFKSMPTS